MLIEHIYEKYKSAQKKYSELSKLEGFYGSSMEQGAKNAVAFFAMAFFLTVVVFFLFLAPMAIYYILIHSQRMRYHWSFQVLLIFCLFLPNLGFMLAVLIIMFGYAVYGFPSISYLKKRFK